MTPSKARFNELRQELRLPLDELAAVVGVSFGSAKAYASESNSRVPPAAVLYAMEAELVGRAVDRVRLAGYEVFPSRKDGVNSLRVSEPAETTQEA